VPRKTEPCDPFSQALTWGFFLNAARRLPDKSYKTLLEGHIVHIHPSSVLFGTQPECVIYTESVHTSRFYLRDLTRIELAWLTEAAPRIYATADSSHRLDMRVGRVADSLSRPM
jgi:ATP-dependent RNA helicase DHX8/PRP22